MENLALDSSKINCYLECPRKFQLAYIENLVPLAAQPAMDDGTIGHKLLEVYYKTRKDGTPIGDAGQIAITTTQDWLKTQTQLEYIADERLRFLFNRFLLYTVRWSEENYQILDVEVGFSEELLKTADYIYVIEGKLDLLLLDADGKITFMDHKYQSRKYDYYQNNVQFLTYALACKTNSGIINYIGLQANVPTEGFFRRIPVHFSRGILIEWKFELLKIFDRIAHDRTFDKNRGACKRGLNRQCQFTHICEQTDSRFVAEIKRCEFKEREEWKPWEIEENAS